MSATLRRIGEALRIFRGERWNRIFRAVAIAGLVIAILRAALFLSAVPDPSQSVGIDFRLYTTAAQSWLTTGQFYPAYELAGPYQVVGAGEILYPPVILWLLVPFMVLPAILWWAIPLGLTGWALYRMRPAWWSLAVVALFSVTHAVQSPFFWGTPMIWLLPAVAWGLLQGWPAAVVLVKPTLAPFILAGMTHPWRLVVGVVAFVLVGLPFGAMWLDWIAAIRNAGLDPIYGIAQNVILILPVIAWFGRTRPLPDQARSYAVRLRPRPIS